MTSEPVVDPPTAPPAEPAAIRACLRADVAAAFDREWELTLEAAKRSQDLGAIHELLAKWRHLAYGELLEPGRYFADLATAERIIAGAAAERSWTADEARALLARRLRDERGAV
jgi:hypothetical protein